MKDELAHRNTTILNLQREIKDLKSKFETEKNALVSKLQNVNMTNEDYEVYQEKLDSVIKENEELSKKLYQRELENKQNMINKNQSIKTLQKQILELTEKLETDKENKAYHSSKYKSDLAKYQEKFAKAEANLKNRIKLLEMEVEQLNAKPDVKPDSKNEEAPNKPRSKSKRDKKSDSSKLRKLKHELKEKETKIQELITNESTQNQKYQEIIQKYLKEQERSQRFECMLIAGVENAKQNMQKS